MRSFTAAAGLLLLLLSPVVPVLHAPGLPPIAQAAGGDGCGGPGYPAPYDVPCNPTVHETSAPGIDRLAGGAIPADSVYCNATLFAACAPLVAANPGATGVQLDFLPTDARTAAERQIERDVADAIDFERTQRGMVPLLLSENLTKIDRRYIEMFESDDGLSRNGTSTDCPYANCDLGGAGYHHEAANINETAFPGFGLQGLGITAVGASAGTTQRLPGSFVSALVCGGGCSGGTNRHRTAVLTNQATYLAVGVKCAADGTTYMAWTGVARGTANSNATPSDYEAGGGTDVAPKVSAAFGHRCPQPAPSFTTVAGADRASIVSTLSSPPSPYFLQPCSATPGAPATMPTGGLTVAFTLADAGGTVLATRSYKSTGAAATMYQPQTFAGLPAGTYTVTSVVSGCAGGSIPVTQAVVVGSGPSRPGAGFVAMAPVRDVDTRTATRLEANVAVRFRLAHVPPAAIGATLNLTAVRPAAAGYVSAFPCDAGAPATSSLNFAAGQTVAAQVTVAVRAGELCVVASVPTDVLVDVNGSFLPASGSGFATAPQRLADTRPSRLDGGGVLELDLSSLAPPDAEAVSVNVVATQAGGDGYLSVYPCGGPPPTVSNLNYAGADTGANLATVLLPPSRHVCVLSSATAAVVVDLAGWWTRSALGGFVAAAPVRVADTRAGLGGPALAVGEQRQLLAPAPGIRLLTVTATGQRDAGWLAVFPCGGYQGTSTSNFSPDAARAAAVVIDGATGVCVMASTRVDVLVDATGTFG